MKKIAYKFWGILFVFTMVSCQKDDIMFYEGPDALSIYLASGEADSTIYSFGLELPEVLQDTVWIKVRAQGAAKDYDRVFELEPTDKTTAVQGEDFDLPQYTLYAGQIETKYPVILYRTAKLAEGDETIVVTIKPNDYFVEPALGQEIRGSNSVETFKIKFNDYLSEPAYWKEQYLDYYVGEFSIVRFQFMVYVYGITDFSVWSYGESANAALNLRVALAKYEAENGPLYEENGNRLTF
ncbi:DUF4843 domain-containing protein [Sphingobacterium sp. LRF_L2]|uniref:DUF4843 domain-containing protein n=1 Tax=Sphingobacterium sp. LRF_L2 TaxID=3369421 RepID=UPI003F623972